MNKTRKTRKSLVAQRVARLRKKGSSPRGARAVAHLTTPHLCLLRAPAASTRSGPMHREFGVATYNVHRWTGLNGRTRPDPARAGFVISELDVDVIALQEVLRPLRGDDPLESLADALGLHVAFAATRVHRRGELGTAILSRWPIAGVSMVDLSFSRLERRVAVVAEFECETGMLAVVATHLALGDRTRHRQVRSLLDHPQLRGRSALLLGDMNAWRNCKATRALDEAMHSHHNTEWPASFPAVRPVLALDRIYSRDAEILAIHAHATRAARHASDHLPVVARIRVKAGCARR